jgi:hypothetical protein
VDQEVLRIRKATGTDDAAYGKTLEAHGLNPGGPWVFQSRARVLGMPLVDITIGDVDAVSFRGRRAVGWIAIGDTAISPFIAMGGCAVGPVALGGITIGVLSFSLWGIAVGALAVGSIAVGWWSVGLAAVGWKSAAGAAVIAKDYAVGVLARAAEANTPVAKEWFLSQWFIEPVRWFVYSAHWVILLIIVISLGRVLSRSRKLRVLSRQA